MREFAAAAAAGGAAAAVGDAARAASTPTCATYAATKGISASVMMRSALPVPSPCFATASRSAASWT